MLDECVVERTSILCLDSAAFEDAVEVEINLTGTVRECVADYVFEGALAVGVAGCEGVDVGGGQSSGADEGRNECGDEGEGCELHVEVS